MEQNLNIIDFHAHILPSADHGSSSLQMSLKQLEFARAHGVDRIVATPHFYPDRHDVKSFLARRNNSWDELKSAKGADLPKIALGAEVLICDGIERLCGLERLCISGTNVILLELPFSFFKLEFRDSVFHLVKNGFNAVLAHADRYDPADIDTLLQYGAKIQLNAESLSGIFIPKHIKRWILQGDVVALGSDIHGNDKSAYKKFSKAYRRILKFNAIDVVKRFADGINIEFE